VQQGLHQVRDLQGLVRAEDEAGTGPKLVPVPVPVEVQAAQA